MKNKQLSALYVDSSGALMLGEPNKVESMINGVTDFRLFTDATVEDKHRFVFINEFGFLCRGYEVLCKKKYRYYY